jgi:hypothetical protein
VNCEGLRNRNKIPLTKSLCFCTFHPSPLPFPSLPKYFTEIQAVFLLLFKSTQTNSTYRDLWTCFLLNVFMLESFTCTKNWNSRRTVGVKGDLINVLHVIEICVILNFPSSSCRTAEGRYKNYPHNKCTLCRAVVINCFGMSFRPECNTDSTNT